MEANKGSSDVLHGGPHSTLTPEEVAKAVARHNRHHPKEVKTGASSGKQNRAKG